MSAFATETWQVVRADALESEAEAIDKAIASIRGVCGVLDNVEQRWAEQIVSLLIVKSRTKREDAAKLRLAS